MIEVYVNSKPHRVSPDHSSLAYLLKCIDLPASRGVAVAVNEEIIPQAQWHAVQLKQADHILVIRATQGG